MTEDEPVRPPDGERGSDEQAEEAPTVIVDMAGEIVEMNPAAEETFPALATDGLDHPLLKDAPAWLNRLDDEGQLTERVYAGGQPYEVHMTYDQEARRFVFVFERA